jgi:toxin ParE1/3/4
MARLHYTPAALSDLEEIYRYIAGRSGSHQVATRFSRELRHKCRDLAAFPFSAVGRARPELGAELRSVAYKGYIIFLRQADRTLEVVNVLEGHRDVGDFYGEDG